MSTVQATLDLNNEKWKVDKDFVPGEPYVILQTRVLEIDDSDVEHLTFGYSFSLNGEVITSQKFPETGKIDIITPNNLVSETIGVNQNTTYVLKLWARNSGNHFEENFNIDIPPPPQPYPSWTWDGSNWVSPVPVPTDGPDDASYKWSEKQQRWFHLVPPLTDFDDI